MTSGKTSGRRLVIAVSGLHGSGRSTQARKLADSFGLRYYSTGTAFREMAQERGVGLEEMSKLAEKNSEFDEFLDRRTKEESRRGGVVIDATLSGWMAEDPDLRIFLTAPIEERARRIAERECVSLVEAEAETRTREASERERFQKYYGVDVMDLSIYDMVLNTALLEPEGTARILKKLVEEYCSNR